VLQDQVEVLIGGKTSGHAKMGETGSNGDTWLFLRPEHIDLDGLARNQDSHRLAGMVTHSLFMGEMSRYEVICGDLKLTVKRQNRGQEELPVGSRVVVSWQPRNALVLD